jgi:ADP-heptose:LPS heptosyltransferase
LVTIDDRALFGAGLRSLLLGPLVARLRKHRFADAVVFSASPLMHLMARATGARFLAGFGPSRFLDGAVNTRVLRELYAAEAYAALLGPLRVPADGLALDFVTAEPTEAADIRRFIGSTGRGTVAFFCGGGRNPRDSVPAKRWAPARFAELGNRLGEDGYRILLLGARDDTDATREVERRLEAACLNACGRFSFAETGALLKHCRLTVTNDSAPLHLSYALLVPTVGLFGPSDPRLLMPKLTHCRAVTSTFPCSPCYGNSLFAGCDRPSCMEGITVESVNAACRDLLGSQPPKS